MTENHDTFDSIVSRGIGNLSLENTQTNEGEGLFRDNIIDLRAGDTVHNTAAEGNYTHSGVGSNSSNNRCSPTQERPRSSNNIDQHDKRPDEGSNDDVILGLYYVPHFEVNSLGIC